MSGNISEKTVEINLLHELIACLKSKLERSITAIAPTQHEEARSGFDEEICGLPPGRVLALQFKRPQEYHSSFDSAKFLVNSRQLQILLRKFPDTGHAFYVFSPLPTTKEFLRERERLMQRTIAVDIHDFGQCSKIQQSYNTVKVEKQTGDVKIACNREYGKTVKRYTVEELCDGLAECKVGMKIKPSHKLKNDVEYSDHSGMKEMFYVYIPEE